VPQQVWTLAREYLEQSDLDLQLDAMETRFFCVEEPYWMGVCSMETSKNGVKQPTQLAFFHTSSFRSFSMLVYALPEAEVADVEKQTRAAAHGLLDYDAALWDRSTPVFPTAYGPGNYDGVFTVQGSEEDEDSLGMTWTEWGDRYTAQYRYEGWNNRFCTSLDTTRKLPTTRGVKVGDSKSAVRAAYPELQSGPQPGLEGDFLWYEGYRTRLVFFFENDKLSRLLLMETD
ncbi:MAG: hypothetical protein HFJ38_07720, partial [Bacilli bacterium]|nr:hypothetical protein [Bacilli bacterium]